MTRKKWGIVLALLAPALLLTGCGTSSSTTGGDSSASSGSSGSQDSWIVTDFGKATPSPTPKSGGTPTPMVTGYLPISGGGGSGYATPTPTCSPNSFNFSRIAGLDVTPGTTSASLSWYNVGGYNLVEFRLYAISQDLVVGKQRDVGYAVVTPSAQCGQMSGTITNLSPKTHYVFSVDAVVTRRSGDGTFSATVFRSHSVPTA